MQIDPVALLTIAGMAFATYLTRMSGLWLMSYVNPTPRVQAWLRQIPGAVLVSIVAPAALANGPADALAAAITLLVAMRTRNTLVAMVAGVVAVYFLRSVLHK